jgi:hypothetical protein
VPYPRTIAWDVSTATLPDALERYLIAMADIYEVSGISDEDQAKIMAALPDTAPASPKQPRKLLIFDLN